MISLSSSFVAVVLLPVAVVLQQQVSAYEFDHDVDTKLCREEILADADICISNSTMWFSCPISCSEVLHGGRGTMAEERSDPEQFFELHVEKVPVATNADFNKGEEISLEDNEGYITMYAVLPMKPGMAKYYYEAIEHIAHVYKYTLVVMILPFFDTTRDTGFFFEDGSTSPTILESIVESRSPQKTTDSKSILLTGYDVGRNPENEVLQYLLSREVVAGSVHSDAHNARPEFDKQLLASGPNIFLVSHTGMYVERIIRPTIELLERRIKVHELSLEHNFVLKKEL